MVLRRQPSGWRDFAPLISELYCRYWLEVTDATSKLFSGMQQDGNLIWRRRINAVVRQHRG